MNEPIINKIGRLHDVFYKNTHYYLYSMTFYHILIIIFSLIGITGFKIKTMFTLSFNMEDIQNINNFMQHLEIRNILFTLMIMFIDFIFLIIMMIEFKKLKLTFNKITIIECIIFLLSVFNPALRMIMLFLSLNTLQITIVYKAIKYIPFMKYAFLTGSYILVIKLLMYPIIQLWEMVLL